MNRRITLIPVIFYGIIFLSTMLNYGCKKNSSPSSISDITPPRWDLSGRIIFQKRNLAVLSLDMNSAAVSLQTLVPFSFDAPKVSRDGFTLAYDAITPSHSAVDIYLLNMSTGVTTDLTPNLHDDAYAPEWSPDGNKIAFVEVDHPSFNESIHIMNRDGSNVHSVTDTISFIVVPATAWSPDGQTIAFKGRTPANSASAYSLYSMSADGSKQSFLDQLGNNGPSLAPLLWSSDSRKIAYGKPQNDIGDTLIAGVYVYDWINKISQKVSVPNVVLHAESFAWLSSNTLLCTGKNIDDSTFGIYSVSRTFPYETKLIRSGFKWYPIIVVSPDSKNIAIFSRVDSDSGIWLYTMKADGTNFQKLLFVDPDNTVYYNQFRFSWIN